MTAAVPAPVPLTVQVARGGAAQQRAIDAWCATAPAPRAVLVEGGLTPLAVPADTDLQRLPSGCVCCVGAVVLRVTLTRQLRRVRPAAALLLLADDAHLSRIAAQLAEAPLAAAVHAIVDAPT